MRSRKWVGVLLALGAANVHAADTWFGASARYERSDNINNSQTDPISETVVSPRVDGTIVSRGGRAEGAGSFFVEQANYLDGVFEDETLYNLLTAWDFELAENRLFWILDDLAVRQVVDTRDTSIESNRTDQNYFVTGPRLVFGSTPRRSAWVSALYSNYWYGDDAGIDSERFTGAAGVDHRVSRITTLTGRAETTETNFTEDGASDFRRDEVSLLLTRDLERNDWLVEIGYNRVTPEQDVDGESVEYDGPMGRFRWRQNWSPRTFTLIHFRSLLSDSGHQAIQEALDGGVDLDQSISTDIFRSTAGGVALHREGTAWTVDFGVRAEREIYESEPLDQDIRVMEFGLGRLMTPRTELEFWIEGTQREYRWLDREDNDFEGMVRIDHVFSSRWFGAVSWERTHRNSNAVGADFEEDVYRVEFGLRGSLLAREQGELLRDRGFGER